MCTDLSQGTGYRHYKGGVYIVVCTATVEASMMDVVVYRGRDGRTWTRPQRDFCGEVELTIEQAVEYNHVDTIHFEGGEVPESVLLPRFQQISDEELREEWQNCY